MTTTYPACLYKTNGTYAGTVSYLILFEVQKFEEDRQNTLTKIPVPVSPNSSSKPTSFFVDLKRIQSILNITGFISDQTASIINGSITSITATQAKNYLSNNVLNAQGRIYLAWRGIDSTFPEYLGNLASGSVITAMGLTSVGVCEVALDKLKYTEGSNIADRLLGGAKKYSIQLNLFLGTNRIAGT